MKKILTSIVLAGAMLFACLGTGHAQATRTWISGVGDDVNPCSRTAPCKTFPGAISKTAAGGEIDTLDPGGFGAVTVTKSITLASEGTGEAGILTAGTNGVTINCVSDPNCVVVLRGLQIDGGPPASNSLAGVKFLLGGKLIIQNSHIRNYTGGAPNGWGVAFVPSTGNSTLVITDTTISNNGTSAPSGGGIQIEPTGTATAKASLTNVVVANNNAVGIRVGGTATVTLDRTTVTNNIGDGVLSSGAAAIVFLNNSVFTGNNHGMHSSGGGAILSLGNNANVGNTTNSSPTGPATPQ